MTEKEKEYWEMKKQELIAQPWADDGTDEEWDEETLKNWEEKMDEPIKFKILSSEEVKEKIRLKKSE